MGTGRRFVDVDGARVALEAEVRRHTAHGWRVVARDRSTVTLDHDAAVPRWWPVALGAVNVVLAPLTILVGPLPLPFGASPEKRVLHLRFRGDGVVTRTTTGRLFTRGMRSQDWEVPDGRVPPTHGAGA